MKQRHLVSWHRTRTTLASLVSAASLAAPLLGQEPEASNVDLFHQPLEVWEDGEAIVTRFDLPAGFELPKHTHPGEEFVYVIEGSATAVVEGQPETVVEAGEAYWIPDGRVHTAIPGPNGVEGIVFRIHRRGEPIRTDVE